MRRMKSFSILVLNAGSSSLKFSLFDEKLGFIVGGKVSDIGESASFSWTDGSVHVNIFIDAKDYKQATHWILDWLQNLWPLGSLLRDLRVVAHRIVHGGAAFTQPTLVTDEVLAELERLTSYAPLHNPQALLVIRASQQFMTLHLTHQVQSIATFDTAFFADLPAHTGYALPSHIVKQHGIKRYGFHGFAHRSMLKQLANTHPEYQRVISFQLGHGCSVTASVNGKPVDTSMGFSPLEGLVMATRGGDIDPGLIVYLMRSGYSIDEVEDMLLHQSGLLGVGNIHSTMRDLLNHQGNRPEVELALTMFCYRALKYLGAYLAVLNGAGCIVFGGGIGENVAEIRKRICDDLSWFGLQLDDVRNSLAHHLPIGACVQISSERSRIAVYVVAVDEALMMAEDVSAMLAKNGTTFKRSA